MPLYIRDDEVDELATKLQRLIRVPTKTEAVRVAIQHEIDRLERKLPLAERVKSIQEKARALGLPNKNFNMKKFSDELWEED